MRGGGFVQGVGIRGILCYKQKVMGKVLRAVIYYFIHLFDFYPTFLPKGYPKQLTTD